MHKPAAGLLVEELCRIAGSLVGHGIPLIVGGGLGLLLRDQHIRATEASTLRSYPPLRATNDIDLFLSAEIISDAGKTAAIRRVLDHLGYEPVEAAKYYQFQRPLTGAALPQLKIDLLAPAVAGENVQMDARRIRPHGFRELHAHVAPEAVTVEEHLTPVSLSCEEGSADVYLPHPFSYVLLKLFAFRDRMDDPEMDYGRHHAFDIYVSVAMLTEPQYDQALELADRFGETPELKEANAIVRELFASTRGMGIVRIREHLRDVGIREDHVDLPAFVADLVDLF